MNPTEQTENVATEGNEDIRTLFVAGLPPDVTPREVYLLFRPFEGYQHCIVKSSEKGGYCFAAFSTREQALTAKAGVEGTKFIPSSKALINIEMAKHNTKRLRDDIYTSSPPEPEKRQKLNSGQINTPHWQNTSVHVGHPDSGYKYSANPQTNHPAGFNQSGDASAYPNQAGYGNPTDYYYGYYGQQPPHSTAPVQSYGSGRPGHKRMNNPPPGVNNTLFVCNIGKGVQESEIVELLKQCAGCTRIKPMNFDSIGPQKPICFVEFQDTTYATTALKMLSGYVLSSNDHGGLVVQYAKTKMTTQQ